MTARGAPASAARLPRGSFDMYQRKAGYSERL